MLLDIDSDVYQKFCEAKTKSSFDSVSDSDFLSALLKNAASCHCTASLFNCNGSQNDAPVRKVCPECQFVACSTEDLRCHIEATHTATGSYSCTCGASYVRLAEFLLHYTDCSVAATDLQDLCSTPRKKIKRSPPSPNNDSNSDTAMETYDSYHHPSVSPVAGPSSDKPFGCPKCFKGFKSKSLLEQHMHLHYPPRYKCRWCGNLYRWPPVYYHHKQKCKHRPSHFGANHKMPDSVEQCVKSESAITSNESLVGAQNAIDQFFNFSNPSLLPSCVNGTNNPAAWATNGSLSAIPLTCICSEVFPDFQTYFQHAITCPGVLSASSLFESLVPRPLGVSSEQPLTSSSQPCIPEKLENEIAKPEDLSSSRGSSIARVQGCNGIFTCSICGKEFNSKLSLKQHVDGKHLPEGKYLCRTCGKRYRWGASFYYHRRNCVASEAAAPADVVNQSSELLTTH